jgi:hypothetical protein
MFLTMSAKQKDSEAGCGLMLIGPAASITTSGTIFRYFAVEDVTIKGQIEGYLIAAMPTANGAEPRIRKALLPAYIRKYLHRRLHEPLQLKPKAKVER